MDGLELQARSSTLISCHPHPMDQRRDSARAQLLSQASSTAVPDEETALLELQGQATQRPRWRLNTVLWACMGTVLMVVVAASVYTASRSSPAIPGSRPTDSPASPMQEPNLSTDYQGRPRTVSSRNGVVAADQGACSEVGAAVMNDGGNAIDAAIATSLCQGVHNPFASGVGGGFFATIRSANGSSEFINSREVAPAASSQDMYKGMLRNASTSGGLAIAVPLELKGLELMWKRWGRLPWARLVQPAAALARAGFLANPYYVSLAVIMCDVLAANPLTAKAFLVRNASSPNKAWRAPHVGELCCQRPQFAETLEAVAVHGAEWLYAPERAETLAAEIRAAGGILTAADFIQAQPVVEAVLRVNVSGYELLLPPPPSSSMVMALMLSIMTDYIIPTWPAAVVLNSSSSSSVKDTVLTQEQLLYEHRMVESMKHGFAVRMALGDPGYPGGPHYLNLTAVTNDTLNPTFAKTLQSVINDNTVLNISEYGGIWSPYATGGLVLDDHGTSHLSVVDAAGNAISMTTTINGVFGSGVISASTGILWNNEMDDFSRPDTPNAYGLAPAVPNFIRPGKRPLSSMSPTIVTQGGKLRLVVGASGGPRIISATLQSIARTLLLGWTPLQALSAPRLHHQLLPNSVGFENYSTGPNLAWKVRPETQSYLASKGDALTSFTQIGNCQLVLVDESGMATAASDGRKDGAPAAARS